MFYVIFRCYYYRGRTGPWILAQNAETGEPDGFETREEAIEAIKEGCGLNSNEYARDYKVFEGTIDSEPIRTERKLSKARFP